MSAITEQVTQEDWLEPRKALSSPLDLLDDDELLENIVDIINENFVLEVEESNAEVE